MALLNRPVNGTVRCVSIAILSLHRCRVFVDLTATKSLLTIIVCRLGPVDRITCRVRLPECSKNIRGRLVLGMLSGPGTLLAVSNVVLQPRARLLIKRIAPPGVLRSVILL